MRRVTPDELIDVEDVVLDHITEVLAAKNADGTLGRLLADLGVLEQVMEMLGESGGLTTFPEGRILVVGAQQGMERDLRGAAKSLGVTAGRLEFITYGDATNYDFEGRLEYNWKYCAVLFGSSPHSAKGKGDDSSIIVHIERHRDRFAECRRLMASGELKVTMTNFKEALRDLMDEGLVAAG